MGELSTVRESGADEQNCKVASISSGEETTVDKSKQRCSHWENYSIENQAKIHRLFLSSHGILEEKDNVLLPQWEPPRSSRQFSSLDFSPWRMVGNRLQFHEIRPR